MSARRARPAFQPLAGLKVIDLSTGVAGPLAGRYLAVLGADVVWVESRRRPDAVRVRIANWLPADAPSAVKLESYWLLEATSPGKQSVVLELDTPGGRDAFLRLVAGADVLMTNLVPEVLEKLRVTHEDLRALNPALVYVATSSFGDADAGEWRRYRTWGMNLTAFIGLLSVTGWEDAPPSLWSISYTDFVGAEYAVAAALAALRRRERSGEGAYVDLALADALAACLGDQIEGALGAGVAPGPPGNGNASCVLQDIFPLADGRWGAVSVRDGEDARVLAATAPGLAAGGGLREQLAAALAKLTPAEADAWFAAADVPFAVVATAADLAEDPVLRASGHWQLLPHARFGEDVVPALPFIVDGERLGDRHAVPALGTDTRTVLRELGYADAEVDALAAAGAVAEAEQTAFPVEPRPFLRRSPRPLGLDHAS